MDYGRLRDEAAALLSGELPDEEALAGVARLLHGARPYFDWVGVYLLAGDTLILGPYAGAPTEHTRIPVGTGVCGTAVAQGSNMVITDVRQVDNYLACSASTRSELVVLIRHRGELVGQFDVDSDRVDAFGPGDEALLTGLAGLAGARCAALAARARQQA